MAAAVRDRSRTSRKRGGRGLLASVVSLALLASLAVFAPPAAGHAERHIGLWDVQRTQFTSVVDEPRIPTLADDGSLWFRTGRYGLTRIAPGGEPIEVTDLLSPGTRPTALAPADDGSMWYRARRTFSPDRVGRVSVDGVEEPLFEAPQDTIGDLLPSGDGGVWLQAEGTLVAIDADGEVATTDIEVGRLEVASDGAAWSAVEIEGVWSFRRITTDLVVTDHPAPELAEPGELVSDLDGGLWFTAPAAADADGPASVGRVDANGSVDLVDNGTVVGPSGLTASAVDEVWFYDVEPGEDGALRIARLDEEGALHRTVELPYAWADTSGQVVPMADGTVWSWLITDPYEVFSVDPTMTVTPGVSHATGYQSSAVTSDGSSVWFSSQHTSLIAEVALGGERTEFGTISHPRSPTIGPDGVLWWINAFPGTIGRLDADGTQSVVRGDGIDGAHTLTTGPDGHLWFTDVDSDRIGRLSVDGEVTLFSDPAVSSPTDIVSAPDGRLWFANAGAATLGRISVDGTFDFLTDVDLDTPTVLARGRHGDVWFSEPLPSGASTLGRITAAGDIERWAQSFRVNTLTLGVDGAMWFTASTPFTLTLPDVGSITTTGEVSTFRLRDSPDRHALDIARGPGGNMWAIDGLFAEQGPTSLNRVDAAGPNGRIGAGLPAGEIIPGLDNDLWLVPRSGDDETWVVPPTVMRVEVVVCGPAPFSDVGAANPFCFDISWLSARDITQGFPDGTFRPAQSIERQAMAAFLWRAADEPEPADTPPIFADVAPTNPFYDAIQWMGQQGISTGTPQPGGSNLFEPTQPVSRQAMAAFIWRAADEPAPTDAPPVFADVGPANPFYDAIQWMGQQGISTGTPQAGDKPLYQPGQSVSRQAMAAFLHRADKLTS